MQNFTPIQVAALQTHNQHFSAGQVGSHGHIVLVAMAQGLHGLAVVPGIDGIGIGKQQDQVDLVVGDAGIDLLVTALLVRKQQGNGQTRVIRDQTTGGGGGKQIVLDQNAFISSAELHHQFFFLIVSQKSDVHVFFPFLGFSVSEVDGL